MLEGQWLLACYLNMQILSSRQCCVNGLISAGKHPVCGAASCFELPHLEVDMSRVIHFEISADDTQRAVQFYQRVFDWKLEK
jgi:hypothetical protein